MNSPAAGRLLLGDHQRAGKAHHMDATTTALLRYLEGQRAHILGALDGLDAAALHRPVLPTGWTCLGLVQHLAVDVEQLWFRQVMAGEQVSERAEPAWQVDPATPPEAVLDHYRAAIERANAVIAATPLEAPPRWWPDYFGEFRLPDLRSVLLHVITETACHAGHLDAARELIDGKTWLIRT
jgi:uncharacterized damage-inducible protein DinB